VSDTDWCQVSAGSNVKRFATFLARRLTARASRNPRGPLGKLNLRGSRHVGHPVQAGDPELDVGREPLHSRIEELGAARLRRGAVRVHHDLFVPVVRRLEHRARLDVDDSAGRHVDALRWVAEIHRQRPG
jgi:hypothetical protein